MGNLQFNLWAFVTNLKYMGIGMLGVFIIIFVIMASTYAISKLAAGKSDN
jgi:hypothetical protein